MTTKIADAGNLLCNEKRRRLGLGYLSSSNCLSYLDLHRFCDRDSLGPRGHRMVRDAEHQKCQTIRRQQEPGLRMYESLPAFDMRPLVGSEINLQSKLDIARLAGLIKPTEVIRVERIVELIPRVSFDRTKIIRRRLRGPEVSGQRLGEEFRQQHVIDAITITFATIELYSAQVHAAPVMGIDVEYQMVEAFSKSTRN